ncbi:MAG: ABC transporter ATP-binding protein [Chitinophagaceae bacterium]|jgi:lipoprotein-releasing system ATP-binding protein|nr:ABC transporter ATP-binding protein [Chitinophagaceae bacterium]MBK7677910.1 ABC transporter ATP-binding protein [Chitinophagaceae bacterium]MBK9464428.1 ABC transporter ATP-binding protein [Chitinophagaceae bacterium]MBK9658444.1 ABC transporter ATP-binding protein [Chitinophagaceae bacterium]MBK9938441.1 ABC transporter ATP-binding protein [Chitinophagaceae bacterium]
MSEIILEARHINKSFHDPVTFPVLTDITFSINKGEFVSVTGKSGCGKSTLLYVLSTMDTDYEGELLIDNEMMTDKKEATLARVRNEKIGFVFQFHYLLNEFNVLRNVMLPGLKLNKYPEKEIEHRAMEKLKILGIDHLALKKANLVSGGEKQRVAIARALINDPHIIMGDEPTGNLDNKNSDIVFDIFKQLAAEFNQTLLIVTHDEAFAARTNRIIKMEDGKIISQ